MSHPGDSAVTAVVGREAESRLLGEALGAAAEGRPSALLLLGEAGVGKTTLVRRTADLAAADGHLVLWAPCLRFGAGEATLLPLVIAFERWLLSASPDVVEMVRGIDGAAVLMPSLGGRGDLGPVGLLPVVGALVARLTTAAPTLLVVDDVQWADAATRDALTYVVAGLGTQRLTVVCTCRDEGLEHVDPTTSWLADLRRLPSVVEHSLQRMGYADTESLVAQALGRRPHPRLVDDVFTRSGGNPYLAELLMDGLDETTETLSDLPAALEDALLQVWQGLSEVARDMTRLLAVAGRPVRPHEIATVAAVLGLGSSGTAESGLAEAVERGVVVKHVKQVWFRHPLLADVLLDTFFPGGAAPWHAAWARTLEVGPDDGVEGLRRLGALAAHLEEADDRPGAVTASLAAAAVARTLRALREEAGHLARAVRLWTEDGGDPAREVEILERAAVTAHRVGDGERALAMTGRALDVQGQAGNPLVRSRLLVREAELRWELGLDAEQPVDAVRAAVGLTAPFPASQERALALAELSRTLGWRGALPDSLEVADLAVHAARLGRTPLALMEAYEARAFARGSSAAADRDTRTALRYARLVDDPDARGWVVVTRNNLLVAQGRLPETIEILSEARRECLAAGATATGVFLGGLLSGRLMELGRFTEAAVVIRESMALPATPNGAASVRLAAARHAVVSGDVAAADGHLARARELIPSLEERPGLEAPPVLAAVLISQDRAGEAITLLTNTFEAQALDHQVLDVMTLWGARAAAHDAENARARRDPRAAEAAWQALDSFLRRRREVGPSLFARSSRRDALAPAWSALFRAEELRCGGLPDQEDAWREAAEACAVAGLRWDEHVAHLRRAELLLASSRSRRVVGDLLRRVAGYADQQGVRPLGARAAQLATAAGVAMDPPVAARPAAPGGSRWALTAREREVLSYLVAGRTYAEIASALFISEKTVSVHVSNLLRKTGTTSRGEVAALAVRLDAAHPPG